MEEKRSTDSPVANTPMTEEQIIAATVGLQQPLNSTIYLAPYDPAWPSLFARLRKQIQEALGDDILLLEHVGSTSVPGLSAKPICTFSLLDAQKSSKWYCSATGCGIMLTKGCSTKQQSVTWQHERGSTPTTMRTRRAKSSRQYWREHAAINSEQTNLELSSDGRCISDQALLVDRSRYEYHHSSIWNCADITRSVRLHQSSPANQHPVGCCTAVAECASFAKCVSNDRPCANYAGCQPAFDWLNSACEGHAS